MRILIVNTYDRGGAANACVRLHEGFLSQGLESKLLLKEKTKNIPNTFHFVPALNKTNKIKNRFFIFKQLLRQLLPSKLQKKRSSKDNFLKERDPRLELFSYPESNFDITTSPLYAEADVINLHWVAGFLDFKTFFEKNTKPVIWTLHDMAPFLGGEHYDETIIGMSKTGVPLSRKRTPLESSMHTKILSNKHVWLQSVSNLTIVAPSKWLVNEAKKSSLFSSYAVHHIPYGLNSENFTSYTVQTAREVLGLPMDKKVLLFVAESASNPRKGLEFLLYALKGLNDKNILVCTVGRLGSTSIKGIDIKHLGYIGDHRMLSLCYSAADAFVIPSLMDNLPNTVLESLLCGTPVIGFPVGGIRDMIIEGKNGVLAKEISGNALKEAIEYFLKDVVVNDRNTIRSNTIDLYDSHIQAQRYKEIFTSVLKT